MIEEAKAAREWLDEAARHVHGAGSRFHPCGTRNNRASAGVGYFRNMFDVLDDHYQCPCEDGDSWVPSMDAMIWTPAEFTDELEAASRSHP